jgi:hypothetical protein
MGRFLSKEEVSSHGPTSEDWELYRKTQIAFESFEVSQLFDLNDIHNRLFVALADGTENDLKDPSKFTNVGLLDKELIANKDLRIGIKYVEGVGTYQGKGDIWTKASAKLDAAFSLSDHQRAETLYKAISDQVNVWKREDPDVKVAVVQVGFSRGAGVTTLLNRMVHERGVKDTQTRVWRNGRKELTGDYLIKPGQIKQAALLYDPVTTFMKGDFTLSPSTVSAFQLNAAHEYRALFPVTSIASGPGQLQGTLPGCHTDIGGGYEKDGLARYARDMGNAFLNRLAGHALFKRPDLPPRDDASCVIHHSWEHKAVYRKLAARKIVQGADQAKEPVISLKSPGNTSRIPEALAREQPGLVNGIAAIKVGEKFSRNIQNPIDRERFMEKVRARVADNYLNGREPPVIKVRDERTIEHFDREREVENER